MFLEAKYLLGWEKITLLHVNNLLIKIKINDDQALNLNN